MLKPICLLFILAIPHFTIYASSVQVSFPAYQLSAKATRIDGATKIIELILETVGLQASFEVRRANVPNAAAVVYHGKRYILYNPSFIEAMDKAAGTAWASVAVLAHEIGHHLGGHTLDGNGSLPAIELEADEFSGFALRKLGATLSEAQVAMRIIASAKATRTHPGRTERLMAIATGWYRADRQLAKHNAGTRDVEPRGPGPIVQSKDIVCDVQFIFDRDATYQVTTGHDVLISPTSNTAFR